MENASLWLFCCGANTFCIECSARAGRHDLESWCGNQSTSRSAPHPSIRPEFVLTIDKHLPFPSKSAGSQKRPSGGFRRRCAPRSVGSGGRYHGRCRCGKRLFLEPVNTESDHFTKTGSGQTYGKVEGRRRRFCRCGGCRRCDHSPLRSPLRPLQPTGRVRTNNALLHEYIRGLIYIIIITIIGQH